MEVYLEKTTDLVHILKGMMDMFLTRYHRAGLNRLF